MPVHTNILDSCSNIYFEKYAYINIAMVRLLGNISIHLDKIKPVLHTFTSSQVSSFVSTSWRDAQQEAFVLYGMQKEHLDNWAAYPIEVAETWNHYSTDVFCRFLSKLLGDDFFQRNNCEPGIVMWHIQEQKPGRITIPHFDLYSSVKGNLGIEKDQLLRLWIPLEDAKFGHALFVGDEVIHKFKAGEIYDWDDELHTGVNAGFDSRYTLLLYIKKNI
jgi:hypothetical protein